MQIFRNCFACLALVLFASCQQPRLPLEMARFFQPLPQCDTLHVEVTEGTDSPSEGDSIANSLFFTTLPPALLAEIDYIADSTQAQVYGRKYFAINDSITAYWVEIRQFWFHHHSLLLYNKLRKAFTDRITLAEWYGGDGGQVLIGSWLFDYDGDGHKDIIRREIAHSMAPGEGDVEERTEQSAALLLWRDGHFVDAALSDTAAVVKRFPIRSFWE